MSQSLSSTQKIEIMRIATMTSEGLENFESRYKKMVDLMSYHCQDILPLFEFAKYHPRSKGKDRVKFPAGTLVKIDGIPFHLESDIVLLGGAGNLKLINSAFTGTTACK